jgi:hypothetical protein
LRPVCIALAQMGGNCANPPLNLSKIFHTLRGSLEKKTRKVLLLRSNVVFFCYNNATNTYEIQVVSSEVRQEINEGTSIEVPHIFFWC